MPNWYTRQQQQGPLAQALWTLRPQLASAAQAVYDQWEQDDEGMDFDLGGGGICDQISQEMSGIIASAIPDVHLTEGGQDGDDHSYLVAYNDSEAYEVDIPPGVYETGGGYSWQKIPDVVISPNDVIISPLNRSDFPLSFAAL